jgi:hypothetical protein
MIVLFLLFLILFIFIFNYYEYFIEENKDYSDYIIICARYKKDVSFLDNIKIKSNVIQKCIDNNSCDNDTCPNVGNEASSYLYYIINNWNTMPQNIIFIHDENESWHHRGKITENIYSWIAEYENTGSKYYEFNSVSVDPAVLSNIHPNDHKEFQSFYSDNLEKYLGKWKDLELKPRKCCAQFIVSRDQIKKNPLEMYKSIYNWILTYQNDKTERLSFQKGLYCEFVWNFMFTIK